RATACTSDSPISTLPPGTVHNPMPGARPRSTTSVRHCSSNTIAATAITGVVLVAPVVGVIAPFRLSGRRCPVSGRSCPVSGRRCPVSGFRTSRASLCASGALRGGLRFGRGLLGRLRLWFAVGTGVACASALGFGAFLGAHLGRGLRGFVGRGDL